MEVLFLVVLEQVEVLILAVEQVMEVNQRSQLTLEQSVMCHNQILSQFYKLLLHYYIA
jgi:hypothetical protein